METHFPELKSNIKTAQILSVAPRKRRNNTRILAGFGMIVMCFGLYLTFFI